MFKWKNLQVLKQWHASKKRKPLVLRGARQVGKTVLVHQLASDLKLNLIEFNFELDSLKTFEESTLNMSHLIKEIEWKLERKIQPKQDLIFFDEIQKCPKALSALVSHQIIPSSSVSNTTFH